MGVAAAIFPALAVAKVDIDSSKGARGINLS